jgi:hypothetical protein
MLTDGTSTIAVYGFKEGHAYVMNPEDWKMSYSDSLSEAEKNDESPCPHLMNTYFYTPASFSYQPLIRIPIEKLDVTNFCIL